MLKHVLLRLKAQVCRANEAVEVGEEGWGRGVQRERRGEGEEKEEGGKEESKKGETGLVNKKFLTLLLGFARNNMRAELQV